MGLNWLFLLFVLGDSLLVNVSGNIVFPVQHKFKGRERNLSALKAHDVRRHGRFLFDIDLELGGNGQPSETGLVFLFLYHFSSLGLRFYFIIIFSFYMNSGFTLFLSVLFCDGNLAGIGVSWSLVVFFFLVVSFLMIVLV